MCTDRAETSTDVSGRASCPRALGVLPKSARTKRKVGKSTKISTNIRIHTYHICMENPPRKRVSSRIRAAHPSCDSTPNASRFASRSVRAKSCARSVKSRRARRVERISAKGLDLLTI